MVLLGDIHEKRSRAGKKSKQVFRYLIMDYCFVAKVKLFSLPDIDILNKGLDILCMFSDLLPGQVDMLFSVFQYLMDRTWHQQLLVGVILFDQVPLLNEIGREHKQEATRKNHKTQKEDHPGRLEHKSRADKKQIDYNNCIGSLLVRKAQYQQSVMKMVFIGHKGRSELQNSDCKNL